MKSLSREKIALIIFALLVVLGCGALVFYITGIGHSFNVAASTIDDVAGDLGDYTALVYEGTAEKKKALNGADAESINATGIDKASALGKDQAINTPKSDEVTASDVVPKASAESQKAEAKDEPITIGQVRNSFLRKHASVCEIDIANPTIYNERYIAKAGKYRFGFIYIDAATAVPHYLNTRIKDYRNAGVDFVVAVVDDLNRVGTIEGIDIVISTQDEGLKPIGVFSDDTFFNDAPLKGEVGAILISPSKVISAKDISKI